MAASQERAGGASEFGRSGLRGIAIGALLAAAGLGGFLIGQHGEETSRAALPDLGAAPAYSMTDQLGRTVASHSFEGKIQIVSFLFPYCTTMCPLIAAHLTNLENVGLRPAGIADKVAIVSFNIDPQGTGPEQMRAFMRQYGWDPKDTHWQYLTGSTGEVKRVVQQGFHVWYQRVSLASEAQDSGAGTPMVQPEVENKLAEQAHADYDIVHNDVLEIVDRQGRIRKIYDDADTVGWSELLPVIQSLVRPAG